VTANLSKCEAEVVRNAIKETDEIKNQILTDDVKRMIKIVEDFIIRKKLIWEEQLSTIFSQNVISFTIKKERSRITIFFPVTR
jgi:hypothetical protein